MLATGSLHAKEVAWRFVWRVGDAVYNVRTERYLFRVVPKVSVIIPTYNSLEYLPEAIESVLDQTFVDFEIIVINDGSSDGTEKWVLEQSDPRLQLISQGNLGKSAARNAGIAKASGDYLAFLDADDCWEPTKLEKQARCLDSNSQIGLVYVWTALADSRCQPTGRIVSSHAEGNVWEELVRDNILACGSTPMARRSCFQTVGLFALDLPLAQDWDMWIRIAARYPFAVIKEPLARYRLHANNTSKQLKLMQACNTRVLERAFQAAPTDVSDIRGKAYQSLNFYLGWIALRVRDSKQAFHFWQQARAAVPQEVFTRESMRLLLSIAIVRSLGPSTYDRLLALNRALRRRLARQT